MRIPKIEAPTLSLHTRRMASKAWIKTQLIGHVVEVDPETSNLDDVSETTITNDLYDTIVLKYILNYAVGLEELRGVIRSVQQLVRPGGKVVAVARACDSGLELAEEMVTMGVPPDELGSSNLTNKEIACLRPKEAVFLAGHATLRSKLESAAEEEQSKVLAIAFAKKVRQSPVEPDIRGLFPEGLFTTKTLDVGLVWHRKQ